MYSDVNIMWSVFKDDILTNFDDEIGLLFHDKYILPITQTDILSQQLANYNIKKYKQKVETAKKIISLTSSFAKGAN